MAGRLTAVVVFFLFITQACARHGPLEVVGVVHGAAYLSPSLQDGYPQIHWRRNNTLKIASYENGQEVQYPSTTYKGRLKLFLNYTLKISHLQKSDSSVYQVYLEDKNGKEHIESILLKVYDPVPKPTVKAKVIRDEPALCKVTLECSVGLEGVTYEWIPPRKLLLNGSGGSEQLVSFNPSTETYICKVSNPVSSNYASLTYKHPCSWIGITPHRHGAHRRWQNSGESSAAASRTVTSVLVALGHLLLLLLLLVLA
ncbi:CD48 antigen-like isoform X1 [Larus michahellis]|uniref:CD48 antigen-like isoform X1 n=1 Tax=Larus michahellis TaxID=119627 RepID=UPI003D9BE55A